MTPPKQLSMFPETELPRFAPFQPCVQLLGEIWEPDTGVCATELPLPVAAVKAILDAPDRRKAVLDWLANRTPDFRALIDIRAELAPDITLDWEIDSSETAWDEIMQDIYA